MQQIEEHFRSHLISHTGPWYGKGMLEPNAGPQQDRELEALRCCDLTMAEFEQRGLQGARRLSRLPFPGDFMATEHAAGIQFEFSLPAGSYATSLVREFTKLEDA